MNCTFTPRVNPKPPAKSTAVSNVKKEFFDYLHKDAERRESLKSQLSSLQRHSFVPDIGKTKFRPPNDPTKDRMFERLSKPIKKKEEQMVVYDDNGVPRQPFMSLVNWLVNGKIRLVMEVSIVS